MACTTLNGVVHAFFVAWTTSNSVVHAFSVAWTTLNSAVHATLQDSPTEYQDVKEFS